MEAEAEMPVGERYKNIIIDLMKVCMDNYIMGNMETFRHSLEMLAVSMLCYEDKKIEQEVNELNKMVKNDEYYYNKFKLYVSLIHRTGFLPVREVEGIITDDDMEEADGDIQPKNSGRGKPVRKGMAKV